MINKFLLVFILGIIETFLYTGWNLAANQRKPFLSSLLMMSYMIIYLFIIDCAIKDANTICIIIAYAISCGVGNYLRVYLEKKRKR